MQSVYPLQLEQYSFTIFSLSLASAFGVIPVRHSTAASSRQPSSHFFIFIEKPPLIWHVPTAAWTAAGRFVGNFERYKSFALPKVSEPVGGGNLPPRSVAVLMAVR